MAKLKFVLGAIAILLLGFGISYPIIINHLIIDEEPVQSDVIIVPEGQEDVRAYRASELLRAGFSASGKIIVSPVNEEVAQNYAKFDVPENQIISETEATSTYENAVITLEMMAERGFDSAIIVSSDYHMLRTKMIYERVNDEYDFELTYVAAYQLVNGKFVPWYEAGEDMEYVGKREFWKYWGYLLGLYRFFDL